MTIQKQNNILFIGASGFVGTRLIDITKEDFAVTNLDKQQSPFFPEITVLGDVRNLADIEKAMQNTETVVLLAAEHRDDVSPTSLYYDVNVQGTRNVLAAMDKAGVKNIIFTSSVAVYGLNKQNPNEEHPTDPFNHYGKVACRRSFTNIMKGNRECLNAFRKNNFRTPVLYPFLRILPKFKQFINKR